MLPVKFETHELDNITQLLDRRASNMVRDALAEARSRASRPNPNQKYNARRVYYLRGNRRVARQPVIGSASEVARWAERTLYRRFIDFFGSW